MRALAAIGGLLAGLSAATGSLAADLGGGYEYGVGQPAGQIVVWDTEPGVVTRAYWARPWRNRHYYPSNGDMPELGRDEDLSKRDVPPPAPSYKRHWFSSSAMVPATIPEPMPPIYVEPILRGPSLK